MKTKLCRKAGFTLVEIMIVVAVIGLLAAIAVPNYANSRTSSQKSACISNMRQIEGAIATWAMEQKKHAGDTVVEAEIFGTSNFIRVKPACPGTTTPYTITVVDAKPTCALVALDHEL